MNFTRFTKMSLAASVAVCSLGVSAFAGSHTNVKMSGQIEVNYNHNLTKEMSKVYDIDGRLQTTFVSPDDKGTAVFRLRSKDSILNDANNGSDVKLDKMFATYKVGPVKLAVGNKVDLVGNFSDEIVTGLYASTKIAGVTLKASAGMDAVDKQVVAAKAAFGPVAAKADVQMTNGDLAFGGVVSASFAGATVNAGYAMGEEDQSIMGVQAKYSVAGVNVDAGFTMSGKGGGAPLFETDQADLPRELGYHYKATSADKTIMFAEASTALVGKKLGALFSMGSDTLRYKVYYTCGVLSNEQTNVTFSYNSQTPDANAEADNSINVEFLSKF